MGFVMGQHRQTHKVFRVDRCCLTPHHAGTFVSRTSDLLAKASKSVGSDRCCTPGGMARGLTASSSSQLYSTDVAVCVCGGGLLLTWRLALVMEC